MNTPPEQWAACYSARGAVGGSVSCSRTPQSWYWRRILPPPTIPAGHEIQTHNLPVTSPTCYPLGHDCPYFIHFICDKSIQTPRERHYREQKESNFSTGPCQSWPPNNPHPLDWLYLSLLSTCSWCVVSTLVPLCCGCRRIIQVDTAHGGGWGETPPHMIVKRFGCTTIHNKALYKCFIHSFILCFQFRPRLQAATLADRSVRRWLTLHLFISPKSN